MNMIQAYKMVETIIKTLQSETKDFENTLESKRSFVKWSNYQFETRNT